MGAASQRSGLRKIWNQCTCCFALNHALGSSAVWRGRRGAFWLQFSRCIVHHGNQTQCFIGREDIPPSVAWTPPLRASSYIARLFFFCQGKICSLKHPSPLQNICHLWESLLFFSFIFNGSREGGSVGREDEFSWGHEFPHNERGCQRFHSPSFIELYWRPPSEVPVALFAALFLLFSAFLLGVFTEGGRTLHQCRNGTSP